MLEEIVAFHEMEVYEEDAGEEHDERDDDGDEDILRAIILKVNRDHILIYRSAKEENRIEVIEKHPYSDDGKEEGYEQMFDSFLVNWHWRFSLFFSDTLV